MPCAHPGQLLTPSFPADFLARAHSQIGNGLFWTFPFILQWLVQRIIGSGLIDNGRLDPLHFRCAERCPSRSMHYMQQLHTPCLAVIRLRRSAGTVCCHGRPRTVCTGAPVRTGTGSAGRRIRPVAIPLAPTPHCTPIGSWLVWGAFLAYFFAGGLFALIMVRTCQAALLQAAITCAATSAALLINMLCLRAAPERLQSPCPTQPAGSRPPHPRPLAPNRLPRSTCNSTTAGASACHPC